MESHMTRVKGENIGKARKKINELSFVRESCVRNSGRNVRESKQSLMKSF